MQLHSTANLTPLTRQEALRVWMGRNGTTFTSMGGSLGISANAVSKLCDNETMPTHRHRQLLELGVPEDLLPQAVDIKPGPKPRTMQEEFVIAFRGA